MAQGVWKMIAAMRDWIVTISIAAIAIHLELIYLVLKDIAVTLRDKAAGK